MADQLCTPTDLAGLLDQDLDTFRATLVIDAATALVQSLVGQRIAQIYPSGSQELQLARAAVLSLAARAYADAPSALGDYQAAYEVAAAAMETSPQLRAALRLQYERRAALVQAGSDVP